MAINFKYLIVNEKDTNFGLWVNTVGFQSIEANSTYPLKTHPSEYYFQVQNGRILHEYQLIYITKGKGFFSTDKVKETPVSRGKIIFVHPGKWHTYFPYKPMGWNEYYIGFDGPIVETIISSFLPDENAIIDIGINERLVSLFSDALEVAENDKIYSQQYLAGIVMHMIGMILSLSRNRSFELGNYDQKIEMAKIMMNEHVFSDINIDAICETLNVSYSWFRKIFKDYTGYSPSRYFQELKLCKAKQLLLESDQSIKEIAYILNYNSVEYFFSIFKKRIGKTPSQYRSYCKASKTKSLAEY